jgi:hypothetical protein
MLEGAPVVLGRFGLLDAFTQKVAKIAKESLRIATFS